MRERRSGLIVMFSSVAGVVPIAGLGAYVAAKFALEGLSETLALEAGEYGINVLIVEPGRFRTNWMGPGLERAPRSTTYESSAGIVRDRIAALHGKQPGDPNRAARLIADVASCQNPPLRLALGSDAIDRIRDKLERQLVELARWSDAGRSTYFPDHGR
jgi:NAD(P)-dependent dehydrogenase (short-subunit alcohol dehydrogenase family)